MSTARRSPRPPPPAGRTSRAGRGPRSACPWSSIPATPTPDEPRQREVLPFRRLRLVVRRRHGLTPYYGFRGGRGPLAPLGARRGRPFRGFSLSAAQGRLRRLLCAPAPRGAARIGGLFFDDFDELGFEGSFALLRAVGDAFLPAYLPIVARRRSSAYGERGAGAPAAPARALRGVQPPAGPRHALRPAERGPHGVDPDEPAAPGAVGTTARLRRRARPEARLTEHFLRPRDWIGGAP